MILPFLGRRVEPMAKAVRLDCQQGALVPSLMGAVIKHVVERGSILTPHPTEALV